MFSDGSWHRPAMDSAVLESAFRGHWLHRAGAERQVGGAFRAIATSLAADPLAAAFQEAAAQEDAHARICEEMAVYYGADPSVLAVSPAPVPFVAPDFGEPDPEIALALHVVGLCCINESIASAWLVASAAKATVPFVVAAHRRHLREEIDHARLGWTFLAGRSARLREALATRIPRLIAANLPGWYACDRWIAAVDPDQTGREADRAVFVAHGHLTAAENRALADEAIADLVTPGFAYCAAR